MTTIIIGEHYYGATRMKGGFGTIDHTDFIGASEMSLLEKTGVYLTPKALKGNMSPDEIQTQFPVNMAYYKLPPYNRCVYLHSCYTGSANHTPSRYGNYFSHSVVVKNNDPEFSAAFIFDQFIFRKSFTVDDEMGYSPRLKERILDIDLSNYRLKEKFRYYCARLRSDSSIAVFSRIIDLIVHGSLNYSGNNVTVCGDKDVVKDIILSVNFFLPVQIGSKISFATYVSDPIKSPFQITGIIPENEIKSFKSDNAVILNLAESKAYEPKYQYTRFLTGLISCDNDEAYTSWQKLNEDSVTFKVTNPKELNAPVLYYNFIKNVKSIDLAQVHNLLRQNLPSNIDAEVKKIVREENPQLYLEYASDKMKQIQGYKFSDRRPALERIYAECFVEDIFRKNYLPSFIDILLASLDKNEQPAAIVFILHTLNCLRLSDGNWLLRQFTTAEEWFKHEDVELEEKFNTAKSILSKYSNELDMSFQNISRYMELQKLVDEINVSNFETKLRKHKNDLSELPMRERIQTLMHCFDKLFPKQGFNFDLSRYTNLISELIPGSEGNFWFRFFHKNDKNDKRRNISAVPIRFVKKVFVYHLFAKKSDTELIGDFKFEDEELRQIKDMIEGLIDDEDVINRFKDHVVNALKKKGIF